MSEGTFLELDEATLLYNATGEVEHLKQVIAKKMKVINRQDLRIKELKETLLMFVKLKDWEPVSLDRYLNEVKRVLQE